MTLGLNLHEWLMLPDCDVCHPLLVEELQYIYNKHICLCGEILLLLSMYLIVFSGCGSQHGAFERA